MKRWCPKTRLSLKSLVILLFIPAIAAASPPLASIKLAASSPPVELVRCHFDEGRVVVRHADTLHVLRAGDGLDGSGLRVVDITPKAAILAIRQTSPTPGLRIIRITRTDAGAVLLQEYATDPASLAAGSTATAPQAPVSAVATGKPISSPDGA
jgi:hypothetical protein